MLQKITVFALKITCLVFFYLLSYMWLGVFISRTILVGAVNVLLFFGVLLLNVKFTLNRNFINQLFILLLLFGFFAMTQGLILGIFMTLSYTPALFLFVLPENLKKDILNFVTKWFAIIVGLGLLTYFVISIIHIRPFLPPVMGKEIERYPIFFNYIFYLKPNFGSETLVRFQGIFLEPGHLALNCVLLLAANNFDFKRNKYLWYLLAGILISISLAGYLLFAIGWILLRIKNMKTMIYSAAIAIIAFIGVQVWGGGNNVVNDNILARLETDKHAGIKGNNRTVPRTDKMYNQALSTGEIWIGVSKASAEDVVGAGYKKFFIMFGIVPAILIFAYYWNLKQPRTSRRYALGFFLLLILIFLDCEYPHWFSWMFSFTLGCGTHLRNSNKISYYKQDSQQEDEPIPAQIT